MSSEPARAEVRLFAALAEKAGTDRVQIPLPPGATAESVLSRLAWFQPKLAGYLPGCRVARDNEFLEPDAPVGCREELAVIPPTSGG